MSSPLRLSVLCGFLAFLVRAPMATRYDLHLGGDSATSYLMSLRILSGDFPLYLYGQDFLFALEQYVAAGFFLILGPSLVLASLVSLLFLALTVGLAVYLISDEEGTRSALLPAMLLIVGIPYLLHYCLPPYTGYSTAALLPLALLFIASCRRRCESA